jgi:ATP-dependent protease HslVU (ClpYQ) peptidase subunit
MTCIVGFIDRKKGNVVIGGDSAGVSHLDIINRKDVKVFKVGDFVMGGTTSFRMLQLLRFSFAPPAVPEDMDLYKYMCTLFVDECKEALKKGGYSEGGTFLVGYKDRLFTVESDWQVAESYDDFAACGCGGNYALGAMAVQGKGVDPVKRVKKALETATHFSGGVRPPFVIETT